MANEKKVDVWEKKNNLPALIRTPAVQKRLAEVLGNEKKANVFVNTLLNIYNGNTQLQNCTSKSILNAALLAAEVGLSISPSLGHAYVLPYGSSATFQIGWKGFVQLALSSNRYLALNASEVFEGEVRGRVVATGEPVYGEKTSDKVVGYIAYFKLVNGFEKTLYMTKEQIEEHAENFSVGYAYDKKNGRKNSVWSKNFDAMAKKTVLKLLLSKYGPMTAALYQVIQADQAVVSKDSYTYIDNRGDTVPRDDVVDLDTEFVDEETGEIYVPEVSNDSGTTREGLFSAE